jgi:D-serine deaminase-like pyridoxal phosphate-dependent protein
MTLTDINTPAALVDQAQMRRNIERMQARMNTLGVAFRPHVKTTKCWPIVQAQMQAGAQGITVSTLKEAQQFFEAGVRDILYAVGMVPGKLAQAAQLMRQGCDLKIIVDSAEAAQAVVDAGAAQALRFQVLIEIDTDEHRSGVKPASDELIHIGHILHAAGMLRGVMTHAGGSYDLNTPQALQNMAEQERSLCVLAAERLRQVGCACEVVSVGSTPTALSAQSLQGVTEVRAGVYVFFDLVMRNVGVCSEQDIALSVLTTVMGHQLDKGWVLIDAGWMAMSRDRGTQKQSHDFGYGLVCDASGHTITGLEFTSANQEHGILSAPNLNKDELRQKFPVGTRLRILPNHACATAAQFPEYQTMDAQGQLATWPRFYGW